ncbi:MAG TPA: transcriptional repressor [Sphingobacterium sp.]|nr:transcriptional repressor [Sphingobacterium sp.]
MEQTRNTILTLLTDKGYIISQQRRIIIDSLCAIQYIGSIDDFWLRLRQQHRIGWATVYNTIRLLEEEGCVIPTLCKDRQKHFVLCVEDGE